MFPVVVKSTGSITESVWQLTVLDVNLDTYEVSVSIVDPKYKLNFSGTVEPALTVLSTIGFEGGVMLTGW